MSLCESNMTWSRGKRIEPGFEVISQNYFKVNQLWSSVVWTLGWLGGLSLAVPGPCTQVAAKQAGSPPSIVDHSLSFFLQAARDIKLDPHLSGSQSPGSGRNCVGTYFLMKIFFAKKRVCCVSNPFLIKCICHDKRVNNRIKKATKGIFKPQWHFAWLSPARIGPSINYAKDWLDHLFLFSGLVWSGKGFHGAVNNHFPVY